MIDVLWAARVQNDSPARGLAFVRWPWVVNTEKLKREMGFVPRYTSRQALETFVRAQVGT